MFTFLPHRLRIVLLGLVLVVGRCPCSYAQLPLRSSSELFVQGIALFQKEQYAHAQHHLETYIQLHGGKLNAVEASYYAALCAIKLGQPDGEELLHQFIKTYPQHHLARLAYYQLGNLCFSKQDFKKSITYYLQVDKEVLDKTMQYEHQYRLAYAYLNEKNFEQASIHFDEIKRHENVYCYAASYYAGYIALKNADYVTALDDLIRAGQNEAYQAMVPYLVLQVYYKQQKFHELLHYIHEINSTEIALKEKDEITLLTAEAYFFTGSYVLAVQHYEDYIAMKDFIVTSEVLYRTAYALYRTGEAYKALQYFKELALQEDIIGQWASYYAGLLYIKTHQKRLALAAFEKAQRMSLCADVQEEARFQYAKMNYELGYFSVAIQTLEEFKKVYATSQYIPEANVLLGDAYLRTHDYDLAIRHIEGLETKSKRMLEVYQKVAFYKGSEYFNNAAYTQAISLFRKSLKHASDQALSIQTQFWLGESLSALQQYEQAIPAYQCVLDSAFQASTFYQKALYGLGYAYFNIEDYAQALPQFIRYITQQQGSTSTSWVQDALIRSADCYYATKNYQQSLQSYERVLSYQPAHVHYQKGIIYNILNDNKAAQASFQAILDDHAQTLYYEKALFEMAHIGLVQSNYPQAIKKFTEFIQKKPQSMLLPDALMGRAIAYVNLKQYNQALQDYEHLLSVYPQHPNAQNALLELSKICMLEGKPEKFNQYLANYQIVNPDASVLEKVTFETAKTLFYDQYYTVAIEKLQEFWVRYPQSKLLPEVSFLIAEAYYRQGDAPNAVEHYKIALQEPQAPFYNKILLRMGALVYKQEDFAQALKYYRQLQDCAKSKKENYHALAGMMKANHALKRYEAVQQYASKIIEQGNMAVNATSEATLFMGKAAMKQGKYQEARAYFSQLVKNTRDHHAAEAQYLLAQLHYDAQQYQQSLAVLFDLNKQFTAYKAWIDQSFLLIADNYLALQEDFQAKATLQSIIDNTEDKTIVASAQQKLETLQHKIDLPVKLSDTVESPLEEEAFKILED